MELILWIKVLYHMWELWYLLYDHICMITAYFAIWNIMFWKGYFCVYNRLIVMQPYFPWMNSNKKWKKTQFCKWARHSAQGWANRYKRTWRAKQVLRVSASSCSEDLVGREAGMWGASRREIWYLSYRINLWIIYKVLSVRGWENLGREHIPFIYELFKECVLF